MTKRISSNRSRVMHLMDSDLRISLREQADVLSERLGTFRFAEATAQSLESSVSGHESALRNWLSESEQGLDLGTLRLFHAVLDHGRQEYSEAAQAVKEAEANLDHSRSDLFETLQRRSKLRDIRKKHHLDVLHEDTDREAAQIDELWLQSRYSRT